MLCGLAIQSEADLHGDLPVRNLIILQVAAYFGDLKPLHISDRLAGSRDRVIDRVFYAIWRGSDQLDLLVDVVTHERIKPLAVAPGEQIPGSKFLSGQVRFVGRVRGLDALRIRTYLSGGPVDMAALDLRAWDSPGTLNQASEIVTQDSSPEAKIELFWSLFRGRTDVFPVRFESQRTGKSGYSPACANEWVRGVCEKPRIRCADCPNRRFIPVTDEVIRWHLSGRDSQGRDFVMGVYPMLLDETCHFLAADFDKEEWQKDAGAFLDTCRRLSLAAALERSRSGNGGHVWFFFEDAISASLARKLGSYVLTETMERRPEVGFGSYDRLFPNQDTLPKGGFGNLIALPLQKKARERGNTAFIDEQFKPYTDQWSFLAALRRISRVQVESLVRDAEAKGRVIGVPLALTDEDDDRPWNAPPSRRRESPILEPVPESLELILADQIYIARENLPPTLRNRLLRLAAFQNPEFYRAQSMRLPTYGKPRIIHCAEEHPLHFALPRGCLEEVRRDSSGIEDQDRDP